LVCLDKLADVAHVQVALGLRQLQPRSQDGLDPVSVANHAFGVVGR
jgi:hypothetical protein